jgi:nucleotide-binding universal stress UspA family protein
MSSHSPRKIAVCVDGSPASETVWQRSLECIIRPQDKVVLVAVGPMVRFPAAAIDPLDMTGGTGIQMLMEQNQEETDALEATLKNLCEQAHRPVDFVLLRPEHGIGGDLVDYISKKKFDHVIIGNRGMGAVKRTLLNLVGLGSVSDYVVHNCHCAAVTVMKDTPSKSS